MVSPSTATVSDTASHIEPGVRSYPVVVMDEQFKTLDAWTAPGVPWSNMPWTGGYGFDLFPTKDVAPADTYTVTKDGLRIRSRHFTDAELARVPANLRTVSKAGTTQRAIIGGQLTTFETMRIKPNFYVEIEATMPHDGWPALWAYTVAARPGEKTEREAEVDIHDGYGPTARDNIIFGMADWNADGSRRAGYAAPLHPVPLAGKRHRFGLEVRSGGVRRILDGVNIGYTPWLSGMAWNQEWYIMLNVSNGVPWFWPDEDGVMQPFLYPPLGSPPADMIVHRVRCFTENEGQVWHAH